MAAQIARAPSLETTTTFPQHGIESPHSKTHAKWNHLTRLWTEEITEFRNDMKSTKWGHSTATTFYLCLFYIWAAMAVLMCIAIPFYDDDSGNHCAPDGSFTLEPSDPLAINWFFQVSLAFGSLSFTSVKTIDIVWDVGVGRCGQTLLAYISWRTFSKYLHSVMMTDPITYQTFWTVFMQDGPSLRSILLTIKNFIWLRGLRSKTTMVFMILTMTFVLAFPTLVSAMTGYSANNQAIVKKDEVNQVLFSDFKKVEYVIQDGDRVNKSSPFVFVSGDSESEACGSSNCIFEYFYTYGASKPEKSTWNETDLEPPTLNITSYRTRYENAGIYVFEDKLYDNEYFSTNDRAICQPIMKANQQTYQWGFSALQLEITLCFLALWTFGIFIAWTTAHLSLASMGITYNAPGNFKSTMSLADAIRKDFREQHEKDVNSLTKREVMSYTNTSLNGGRVMVQSPPLNPSQSAWKWIWTWIKANKVWTVAFAFASLSPMLIYVMPSLIWLVVTCSIWLAMTFSVVAGWGWKTRYLVLLLSLVLGGILLAGYLPTRRRGGF